MKTKAKLSLIVTIVGAMLLLSAFFLVWNSIATYRTVKTVTSSLEALTLLKDLQAGLHQLQYTLVHFMVSGERDALQNYRTSQSSIESKLTHLSAVVRAQQRSGNVTREGEAADAVTIILDRVVRYRRQAESSIQLKRTGRARGQQCRTRTVPSGE